MGIGFNNRVVAGAAEKGAHAGFTVSGGELNEFERGDNAFCRSKFGTVVFPVLLVSRLGPG